MLKLVVIGTIAVAVNAYTHQIISEVKSNTNLWTPTELADNQFQGWSRAQLNALCGTIITPMNDLPTFVDVSATPTNFDSRVQWPGKIGAIRDQQQCGACWAFGASESFADRYAISTGDVQVFSPEEMVSCDQGDYGCQGGYLNVANAYLVSHGVALDSCTPYTAGSGSAPACKTACDNGSVKKLYKGKAVATANTPASIKNLIASSGPVETGFTVYEDFFAYKSGIYHHVSGGMAGGHAVKIIGWGVESGVNYWIVANSWGTGWGINGTFKIKQGECGIDQAVYGVTF
jgi:cathepsin B